MREKFGIQFAGGPELLYPGAISSLGGPDAIGGTINSVMRDQKSLR